MNPQDRYDVAKLANAVWDSRRRLEPFQRRVAQLLADIVGPAYGEILHQDRSPVNKGALAVVTYMHRLMSNDPRVLYTAKNDQLATAALEREAAMNKWIVKEEVFKPLNAAVLSGLFGFGVVQVGITPFRHGDAADPGKTSIDYIGIDDWFQDMTAKRDSDWGFCGHRYRVPLHRVQHDESIPIERRRDLRGTEWNPFNEFGNVKLETFSEGTRYPMEWQQYMDLWQVFLPEEQVVMICAGKPGNAGIFDDVPLKTFKWEGPKRQSGMYYKIQFHDVLDNPMPLAPVELYHDANVALQTIANKDIRGGEGFKKLLLVDKKANMADVDAITNAKHGEAVALDNPGAVKEVTLGGPDQGTILLWKLLDQTVSSQSGNIDQLAGLGADAPTATQEQMMLKSASGTLNAMQARVVSWLVPVFRGVDFWLFDHQMGDPQLSIPASYQLGDTGMSVPFTMTPDLVQGQTDDYDFEIAPYSHIFKSPQERLGALTGATQTIMPLVQAAAQGAPIDVGYVIQLMARYLDMPEIARMWNPALMGAQQVPPQQGGDGGGISTGGTREYVRRDRNNAGKARQDSEFMSALGSMKSNGHAA